MNGAIDSAIWYQATLVPMALHDQKCHIAPHFSCLDLRNAKVPLMNLLALCDAGASGLTWSRDMLHIILIVLS